MTSRDPKTIKLYASNNGVDYVLVDSRTNVSFASRFQPLPFTFTNSTPYKYYRFNLVSTPGYGVQLSEIELIEGEASPGLLPLAPSGLRTLFTTADLVNLAWNDNSTNETRFILEQSLTNDFTVPQASYTVVENMTKYIAKGLTANTTYYFRVKSLNSSGNSASSNVISVRTPPADNFPLALSVGRLKTSSGQPFLIVGDSPWFLIMGSDMSGTEIYLENRRQKGVNSLVMCLISSYYNGPADAYGNMPFLTAGDFTTPNPQYFDNVDYVIGKAREKGMEVFLYPAWLGYDTGNGHPEGWYTHVIANGPAKMYQYGRYLGQRYKDHIRFTGQGHSDTKAGQ